MYVNSMNYKTQNHKNKTQDATRIPDLSITSREGIERIVVQSDLSITRALSISLSFQTHHSYVFLGFTPCFFFSDNVPLFSFKKEKGSYESSTLNQLSYLGNVLTYNCKHSNQFIFTIV